MKFFLHLWDDLDPRHRRLENVVIILTFSTFDSWVIDPTSSRIHLATARVAGAHLSYKTFDRKFFRPCSVVVMALRTLISGHKLLSTFIKLPAESSVLKSVFLDQLRTAKTASTSTLVLTDSCVKRLNEICDKQTYLRITVGHPLK